MGLERINLDEEGALFDPEAIVTYCEPGRKDALFAKFIAQKLCKFCEVLNRSYHLRGVGVLVIVPRNYLYLIGIVVDLCNHGLSCIEERTVADADYVRGNDLVNVVAEGLGGSSLHSGVDALNGNVLALNNCNEDCCRTCAGILIKRQTVSNASQQFPPN